MQLEYSRYLKQMAKRLNCVVVTLTQVNTNDQVKYGTAVEENLDTWFKWKWREDEEQLTNQADVKLALCRHAPPASFPAKFELDKMTINIYPAEKREKGIGGPGGPVKMDKEFREKLRRGDI